MSGSKRKVGASSSASSDNHNKRVQDASGSSTIEGNLNLKQYYIKITFYILNHISITSYY
jgi:hypothetical protein